MGRGVKASTPPFQPVFMVVEVEIGDDIRFPSSEKADPAFDMGIVVSGFCGLTSFFCDFFGFLGLCMLYFYGGEEICGELYD